MEWLENTMAHDSDQAFRRMSDQREAKELLDWALDKLSASDRMVVELVYLEELPIKEAAELLGWSATNVKVRLFRTRRKLYKLLSDFMKKREGKNDELY
jgi:RNA polymerase sigma-70 factor (ECF subfamily)